MEWTRRTMLGVATAGLALPAFAQDPTAPLEAPLSDPLPLRALTNLMTRAAIDVRVANRGPFRFVIDSGAGRTSISRELADQLQLEAGRPVMVHGVTAAELTDTVKVSSLRYGRTVLRRLEMPVFPYESLQVDGLLGLDALRRFIVTFDVAGGTVILDAGEGRVTMSGANSEAGSAIRRDNALSARRDEGQLVITSVHADDTQVQAFVDSGAQYSVGNMLLYRQLAERRPRIGERRWPTPILGVTGQTILGEVAILERLRVGGQQIDAFPMLFADLHAFEPLGLMNTPALLMGADLIGAFERVSLDFRNSLIRFGPLRPERFRPSVRDR